MSVQELQWLVGTALGAVLTVASLIIAAFNMMAARVSSESAKRSADVAALHAKVDTVKDDMNARIDRVKEDYVRADHLDQHMLSLREMIRQMGERLGQIDGKIDRMSVK